MPRTPLSVRQTLFAVAMLATLAVTVVLTPAGETVNELVGFLKHFWFAPPQIH